MENTRKNILHLNIAVMLFGFSGVIGQFVDVPPAAIAWGRVICSTVLLFTIAKIKKEDFKLLCRKDGVILIVAGIILAVHWTSFFQSIQLSSVAIGTLTFSTFPLFLTFLEPIVFREHIRKEKIFQALLLLVGVLITIPEFSLANEMTMGIIWGMVSSMSYAVLVLMNRYLAERYSGRKICFYEQLTTAVVLTPIVLLMHVSWQIHDIAGVAVIGIICTGIAYSVYVGAQKGISAQTVGIVSGMETVYGILFALIFLREVPTAREIIGGMIIMGVVFSASMEKRKS